MSQIGTEALQLVGGEFCLRWSIALLHFLWQGAVIGVLVFAAGRLLRARSAQARYMLYSTVLVSLPVCLAVTFATVDVPPSPRPVMAHCRAPAPDAAAGNHDIAPAFPHREPFPIVSTPGETSGGQDIRGVVAHAPIEAEAPADDAAAAKTPAESPNKALPSLARAAQLATGIYLAGVLCFFLRFALAVWGGHRLRTGGACVDDLRLLELIADQAHKIGLRCVPLVKYCGKVAVPTVVGVIRPMILVPASSLTGLEPEQLAIIIGHELAHIRRYDLVMNLVQRVIESLLFFHPVVWYVSRRMSAEREACCDDLVVSSGCEPMRYAGALLRMAEICTPAPGSGVVALTAAGDAPSQFELRIHRLLSANERSRLRLTRTGVTMVALLLTSVVLSPAVLLRLVRAQDPAKAAAQVMSESVSEKETPQATMPEDVAAVSAADDPTEHRAPDLPTRSSYEKELNDAEVASTGKTARDSVVVLLSSFGPGAEADLDAKAAGIIADLNRLDAQTHPGDAFLQQTHSPWHVEFEAIGRDLLQLENLPFPDLLYQGERQ